MAFGTIGFGFSASVSGGGGGGLTSISANNGLRTTSVSNVQFGSPTIGASPLLQNTYLNLAGFNFTINGGATATYNLLIEDTGVSKSEIIIDSTAFVMQTTTNATDTITGLDITSNFGGAGAFRRTDTTTGKYNGFYYLGYEVGWNVTDNITQYEYHLPPPPYVVNSVLADISGTGFLTWASIGSIAPTITADNGLNISSGSNVQLGGTLIQNTTITSSSYSFLISGTRSGFSPILEISNSSGLGLKVTSSAGIGAYIIGNSVGLQATGNVVAIQGLATASGGVGVEATGLDTYGLLASGGSATINNDILPSARLRGVYYGSGSVANNTGALLQFAATDSINSDSYMGGLSFRWTDITSAVRTSQFEIENYNLGVKQTIFTLKGTGQLQLNNYISGAFSGTAVNTLSVDASGNVITTATPTTLTFDSGLTRTLDNVQLGSTTNAGSPLLNDTYLNIDTYDFKVTANVNAVPSSEVMSIIGADIRIGDLSVSQSQNQLVILNSSNQTYLEGSLSGNIGLLLDYNNFTYKFGETTGNASNTHFLINSLTGYFEFWGYDPIAPFIQRKAKIDGYSGQLTLDNYGTGISGTAAYGLAVDSSGNVITTAVPVTPPTLTFDSGLTRTLDNVQLGSTTTSGSPLLQNTFINIDNYSFRINGGASAVYGLLIEDASVSKSEMTIDSTSFNQQTTTNATNTVSGLDLTSSFGGAGSIRRTDISTGFYTGLYYLGYEVGWNVTDNINQYSYHFPPPPYVVNSVLADVSGSGFLTWVDISTLVTSNSLQAAYDGGQTINGITFTIDYVTNTILNIGTGVITSGSNITAIGLNAGNGNTGSDAIAIGYGAGQNNIGGQLVALGENSATTNEGIGVVGIGYQAAAKNTGNETIAIGSNAGFLNSGSDVIAIGQQAALQGVTGNLVSNVVAIGNSAGNSNLGNDVVAIGQSAALGNQLGADSVISIGYLSGNTNAGSYVVGIGTQAAYQNVGNSLVAIGLSAAQLNTGSTEVIAIGTSSSELNSGSNVVSLGLNAAKYNSGSNFIAIGQNAGLQSITGNITDYVVAIGTEAGQFNTSTELVAIGHGAGAGNFSPNVVAIGYYAGNTNSADNLIAIGDSAGNLNDISGIGVIGIGKSAGANNFGAGNIYVGNNIDNGSASATSWGNRIGIGTNAIVYNDNAIAIGNIAQAHTTNSISIGAAAGNGNISTGTFIAIGDDAAGSGDTLNSIAIGTQALYLAGTKDSVAIGSSAGYLSLNQDNVYIGNQSGYENHGGSAVMLGLIAGAYNLGQDVTAIGQNAGIYNNGSSVVAIGVNAGGQVGVNAYTNDNLVAIGSDAGYTNQAAELIAIGTSSGSGNQGANSVVIGAGAGASNIGDSLVAVGSDAGVSNEGNNVIGIGEKASKGNLGNNVVAIGYNAANGNQASNVIALGTGVGVGNGLNNVFIVSNSELPSFASNILAAATLSFGTSGNTYLYYNSTTFAIEGVRIP